MGEKPFPNTVLKVVCLGMNLRGDACAAWSCFLLAEGHVTMEDHGQRREEPSRARRATREARRCPLVL